MSQLYHERVEKENSLTYNNASAILISEKEEQSHDKYTTGQSILFNHFAGTASLRGVYEPTY